MQHEPTATVPELTATAQGGQDTSARPSPAYDRFLEELMKAVEADATIEALPEPPVPSHALSSAARQASPVPSPAPACRERVRYGFD